MFKTLKNLPRSFFIFAVMALMFMTAAACGGGGGGGGGGQPPPFDLTQLGYGFNSGVTTLTTNVIKTQSAWTTAWQAANPGSTPPAVNFDTHMVVMVHLGYGGGADRVQFTGGSFFQAEALPAILRALSPYTPFYWATQGFRELLLGGGGFVTVLPWVGLLASTGTVALVAGSRFLHRRMLRGATG